MLELLAWGGGCALLTTGLCWWDPADKSGRRARRDQSTNTSTVRSANENGAAS